MTRQRCEPVRVARSQPTTPATDDLPAFVTPAWKRALRRRLLAWFDREGRDLPWRTSSDPYRIWVSEIMLQQTQVSTVIPYFERFIVSFPSVVALAAANESDVLRHWEGLGYYRRARQLYAAAQVVAAEHGGLVPREFEAVRGLPGIGRYTAGAIVSLAFDQPIAILEANTVRLWSRLIAYAGPTDSPAGQKLLWQAAQAALPSKGAGRFNSALMDLGSLVCTPKMPRCGECPLRSVCESFRTGRQQAIPVPKVRPASEAVHEAAVVVWRRGRVLLLRRSAAERWAGLWDFPRFQTARGSAAKIKQQVAGQILKLTGQGVEIGRKLTTIKHGVTRFRITLDCYEARCRGRAKQSAAEIAWLKPAELEGYPLSMTGRKLARLLLEPSSR